MEFTREQLIQLEKELYNKLMDNKIYPEEGSFSLSNEADLSLDLYIDGDWKHDHIFCDNIVKKFCEDNDLEIVKQHEEEVSQDGTDSYQSWNHCPT